MMEISDHDRSLIEITKKEVMHGDLYRALHNVGDDTTKADIEDVLQSILDEETYRTVLAVFKLAVDDDINRTFLMGVDEESDLD